MWPRSGEVEPDQVSGCLEAKAIFPIVSRSKNNNLVSRLCDRFLILEAFRENRH